MRSFCIAERIHGKGMKRENTYSSIASILSSWTSCFTYFLCGHNNFEFAYSVYIEWLYFAPRKGLVSAFSTTVSQVWAGWLKQSASLLFRAEMKTLQQKQNKKGRDDCTLFPARIWHWSSPQLSAHFKHLWPYQPVQIPWLHGCSARQVVQGCSLWETQLRRHGGKQWTQVMKVRRCASWQLSPLIPNGMPTWQGWVAAEEEEALKARAADPGSPQIRAGGALQWDFTAGWGTRELLWRQAGHEKGNKNPDLARCIANLSDPTQLCVYHHPQREGDVRTTQIFNTPWPLPNMGGSYLYQK